MKKFIQTITLFSLLLFSAGQVKASAVNGLIATAGLYTSIVDSDITEMGEAVTFSLISIGLGAAAIVGVTYSAKSFSNGNTGLGVLLLILDEKGNVLKEDVVPAQNYLNSSEIETINSIMSDVEIEKEEKSEMISEILKSIEIN